MKKLGIPLIVGLAISSSAMAGPINSKGDRVLGASNNITVKSNIGGATSAPARIQDDVKVLEKMDGMINEMRETAGLDPLPEAKQLSTGETVRVLKREKFTGTPAELAKLPIRRLPKAEVAKKVVKAKAAEAEAVEKATETIAAVEAVKPTPRDGNGVPYFVRKGGSKLIYTPKGRSWKPAYRPSDFVQPKPKPIYRVMVEKEDTGDYVIPDPIHRVSRAPELISKYQDDIVAAETPERSALKPAVMQMQNDNLYHQKIGQVSGYKAPVVEAPVELEEAAAEVDVEDQSFIDMIF